MKISTFIASIIGFVLILMLIVVEPSGPIEYRTYEGVNYYETFRKDTFRSKDGDEIIFEDYGSAKLLVDPNNPDFNIYYVSMLEVYVTVAPTVTYKCDIYGTCGRGQFVLDNMFLDQLSVFERHEIPVSDQNLISPLFRVVLVVFFYAISVVFYKVAALNGFEQYKIIQRIKGKKTNEIEDQKMYSRRFHKWLKISLYVLSFSSFVFLFKFIYWIK